MSAAEGDMRAGTRRIALVGIDGSGKTTLVDKIQSSLLRELGLRLVRMPYFHEVRDLPLADLSRDLAEISRVADELDCGALKATALYIAASMFGAVEQSVISTFSPTALFEERHPLVDILTYAPLYVKLIARGRRPSDVADEFRERLAARRPTALAAVEDWVASEAKRLGEPRSLWTYADHVRRLAEMPPAQRIACAERDCRTTMPDKVIWLDVAPELAARRLRGRETKSSEMHEQLPSLITLREQYRLALEILQEHRPGFELVVMNVDDAELEAGTLERLINAMALH